MANTDNRQMVVGLDIGTTKVVALVGEVNDEGRIKVVGLGSALSLGMKKGMVVNIESTVEAIRRAVGEAEQMADCEIRSAYVGIAGKHVSSLNSHGMATVRSHEVEAGDIDQVLGAAQAVKIPADQRVLHVLPQQYIVDNQDDIREPTGMSGVRLEARVHLVTCAETACQNLEKCVVRCGLQVDGFILEQLASSHSVLTEDERELGTCLLDIGGGTTDIALFNQGSVNLTSVLDIAGDQITKDIAMALRTPTAQAEEIKRKYACALTQLTSDDEIIRVPGVGDRPTRSLSRHNLAEVIEPRCEEIFNMVHSRLTRNGDDSLIPAGVVLTGGTAKMEGAVELAEEIFHASVRLGLPIGVQGMEEELKDPIYSTAVGLLIYGVRLRHQRPKRRGRGMFNRAVNWLKSNF